MSAILFHRTMEGSPIIYKGCGPTRFYQSNIIKGKIQHDKTFAAATATAITFKKNFKFNTCNVVKLNQDYRVAKN